MKFIKIGGQPDEMSAVYADEEEWICFDNHADGINKCREIVAELNWRFDDCNFQAVPFGVEAYGLDYPDKYVNFHGVRRLWCEKSEHDGWTDIVIWTGRYAHQTVTTLPDDEVEKFLADLVEKLNGGAK